MLKFLLPLVLFAALVGLFIRGLDPNRDLNALPSPYLGKEAPSLDLPDLANPDRRVTSDAFAGQIALVNFWATWCVGCRQEHGYLMELKERGEVPIYGVDWRDQRDLALEWLDNLGDPYVATGFDGDATTGIDWGVYGAPETFLIGRDGRVIYKHLGPLNDRIWREIFVPLIDAEREAAP